MILTPSDLSSPTWVRLQAHYLEKLQALRERNDLTRPEPETIALRATIKTIKEFLASGQPEAETEAPDIE